MNILPTIGKNTVYASDYCHLDSNVTIGGGTDDIKAIQEILDMAPVWGSLHLIVDGAALISTGLRIHSNTTIECLNKDCGFYLADGADYCIARNADWSIEERKNKNIKLIGGTYNHNCLGQAAELKESEYFPPNEGCSTIVVAMKFYGVEDFTMQNLTICDQRRFALLMGNWKNVVMDNIDIPLPHILPHQNQDGLHFHSPGENLQLRNIHGRGGDDFIAINTDEGDGKTSISGVVIENVYLDNATQAIRLLCKGEGTLENVFIRNVYGTYTTYGFFINQWMGKSKGHFKNINIENVFLKQADAIYDYTDPFAFYIGGIIDNITIKNVSFESDSSDYRILRVTDGSMERVVPGGDEIISSETTIKHLVLDGVYMDDKKPGDKKWVCFDSDIDVERFVLKNVSAKVGCKSEALVHIEAPARVKSISLSEIHTEGFEKTVKGDLSV